jgi:hypothetical protein
VVNAGRTVCQRLFHQASDYRPAFKYSHSIPAVVLVAGAAIRE